MPHAPSTEPRPTATALLSVLARLGTEIGTEVGTEVGTEAGTEVGTAGTEVGADPHAARSPLEAGRRVLRQGVLAMGAAGGIARIVGSPGPSADIIEVDSAGSVPGPAAELLGGGEDAWLSTCSEIRARF